MRLLIVEDERDLNNVLVTRLKNENYSIDSCYDGNKAWELIQMTDYDGIILDIMLPGIDGITILRNMRDRSRKTPVLLLTAKDSVEDRVCGLDTGADDYLVKPFAFDELLARIRAMVRRKTDHVTNIYTLDNLSVNCTNHIVTRGDMEIPLSSKEFALLEYLIRNQGIVLSKDMIQKHVWSYDFDGDPNIIKVYIRYLRKKVDDNFEKKLIHTIRNYGYVMKEEGEKL